MSKAHLLNEKSRLFWADRGIYTIFLVISVFAGLAAGFCLFKFYIYENLSPLQKHYFKQFRHSAFADTIGISKQGTYTLVVRELTDPKTKKTSRFICNEKEIFAEADENGDPKYKQDGTPLFFIKKDVAVDKDGFRLMREKMSHTYIYNKLSTIIFDGYNFRDFFQVPVAFAFMVSFSTLVFFTFFRNKSYNIQLKGKYIRGTRLISSAEYAKQMRNKEGIGIEVAPRS